MAIVISIANQKGGIGKTTTATSIATILSDKGYKTLLIDSDLQGNSTDTYRASFEGVATLYDILLEERPADINETIQHTEMGDIIASDPLLREADSKLSTKGIAGYKVLKKALSSLKGYDFVIIDTAPTINMVLRNVLTASDYVVIPITADRYGFQGLYELNISIKDAQELNDKLKIAGILLVRYNSRTILAREVKETLVEEAHNLDTELFKTTIRECNKVKEAQTVQSTLLKYDKSCTASKDYLAFVDELLEEIK